MSRIGKKVVTVPAGVKVSLKDRGFNVEGPKGKLSLNVPATIKVVVDDSAKAINVGLADGVTSENKQAKADWGSTRAHINNMIEGVTKGYEKQLEVVGVGWVPSLAGKQLKLVLGFANPIMVDIPVGVNVVVDKQIVRVSGSDKQAVGQFASKVRSFRKPEPYNGKGVKYFGETIRRKQGKQFGA